ncbi:glutathione S-transferase family protein [Candidatus Odyssella thessalonicensis]|uniref:glutathione S-transferase family protein n=1 Tax=Candidatus Odyssella thessalonicensis TaxID=84647 RepID=UPI000225B1EC|nr:glutathione S-transferase family protein [Candidatus Odyssella thessalonicensis]
MRTLYQYMLCPFSRKVRLVLGEKRLDFDVEQERFWERREEFISLNPAGQVPVFTDLNGTIVADSYAICEYLEEAYPERLLLGQGIAHRAEVRRLAAWFDDKFAREVSLPLIFEKTLRRFMRNVGPTNSQAIRQAKSMIGYHLDYISWLIDRRRWLAGDELSLADLAAAAHLSVIDYLGDVPWDGYEVAKDWYMRIKSRPSFRPLLQDRLGGLVPAQHYQQLDF